MGTEEKQKKSGSASSIFEVRSVVSCGKNGPRTRSVDEVTKWHHKVPEAAELNTAKESMPKSSKPAGSDQGSWTQYIYDKEERERMQRMYGFQ